PSSSSCGPCSAPTSTTSSSGSRLAAGPAPRSRLRSGPRSSRSSPSATPALVPCRSAWPGSPTVTGCAMPSALSRTVSSPRASCDVARVFVGYAACAPTAPGPCELPAVAYTLEAPRAPTGTFATGEWHTTWSPREYAAAIETVRAAIYEGDVYQVNLVQHLQ